MTRTLLISALAASAAALCAVPALAQDKVAYDSYSDEIIVIAPGVQRETIGRSSSGARIEQLTTSSFVTTADLNLRYDSDVRELQRRIRATASDACRELDRESSGVILDSQGECVRGAVRDAMVQADAMIYAARG